MHWPRDESLPDGFHTKEEAGNVVKTELGIAEEADISDSDLLKFFEPSGYDGYYVKKPDQQSISLQPIPGKGARRRGRWGMVEF